MSKQDRGGVRTAQDLERKYDLASLLGIKKAIKQQEIGLTKTETILEDFIKETTKEVESLQAQIDGNITTHFYSGVPTMDNMPASEWEDFESHLGDLYYDKDTGTAYRFIKDGDTYKWLELADNAVSEALALANAAQDTADSKRRVFVVRPTPPYENGDLWFNEGDIYICQISKPETESYEENDFIIATKYTDDTKANKVGKELTVLSGTVLKVIENNDKFSVSVEKEGQPTKSFMEYTSDGLSIGYKINDSWQSGRALITPDAYKLLDSSGKEVASFGADKIELLNGLGTIYAVGQGQLGIGSKSTRIQALTIDDGYSIAEMHAQSTTSDALKPMLTLSCRTGIPGSVSGSGAFFEAEILKSASITISDEKIVFDGPFVANHTQCVLDGNGFLVNGILNVDGSGSFDGEQKFKNTSYCPTITDSASGVGCAFKASRGLFNEALIDKLIMTALTGKISFYKYTGTSSGLMTGLTEVASIQANGQTTGLKVNQLYNYSGDVPVAQTFKGTSNYALVPATTDDVYLGNSTYKWYRLYQSHSSVSTSDKRKKENIKAFKNVRKQRKKDNGKVEEFDVYAELFDKLEPVEYNFIEGEKRKDFGLIAQDVLDTMLELGFEENELDLVHHDTWVDEETGEKKDAYGIAYENLIALLIYEVQKLKGKVN